MKLKRRRNQFDKKKFCQSTRKRFRKRYKKGIDATDGEIMRVINEWLESVIEEVVKGKKVKFDKHSYVQVVGVPSLEHKGFQAMIRRGKSNARGFIKKADNMNYRRGDFVFKIVYVNETAKEKMYFTAHKDFSSRVHKALIETNNYYEIKNESK